MEFLQRTTRLVGWSGVILVPLVGLVWGARDAVGLASGLLWALANVRVLTWLVEAALDAKPQSRWSRLGMWVVKIPVLYVVVALLLLNPLGSPLGFLVGFSLWFLMLCVSALRGAAA